MPQRVRWLVVLLLSACGGGASGVDAGVDAGPAPLTLIHQQGVTLVDASGQNVVLTGTNLGGWLLWEGPVWGAAEFSERELRTHLAPVIGNERYDAFVNRVHDEYVTEADIARISQLGFNVVRVAMNHTVLESDAGWATVDRVLEWCEKHRVYAVLDLHSAPGGQSRYFFSDPDLVRLWDSPERQDETVALWRAIATRYASRDVVAAYDLLNEPDPPSGAELVAMYTRIIAAIREVDSRHVVMLEGSNFARDFTMFSGPVLDGNLVYSFHMYGFAAETRVPELEAHAATAEAQQVPMWCGEFGVNAPAWVKETTALFDDPKYRMVGRSFWTWKQRRADHDEYALMRIQGELPAWQVVVNWASTRWLSREPTEGEVNAALDELVTAAAFDRCEERSEMAKAILNH